MDSKDLTPLTVLEEETWYLTLVSDLRAILVEYYFTHNWALVEGYHALGKRLVDDKNFKTSHVTQVANSIRKDVRTVQRAIQFYKKYPDLTLLPSGKNISWGQICNKYLPTHTEKICLHKEIIKICKKCRKIII